MFDLITQSSIEIYCSLLVLDGITGIPYGELNGLVSAGSISIDSGASSRRTCTLTLIPDETDISVTENSAIWENKDLKLSVGIREISTGTVHYFSQGYYSVITAATRYDSTTNQLTVTCQDWISKMNGLKNGAWGTTPTTIPVGTYDSNGNVITYNVIKEAMITILNTYNFNSYRVEDIGEYKAMPQYNPNWSQYRTEHPLWDKIPYDLEFSRGINAFDVITKLAELYPNYETFFDEDGRFICQMIPSHIGDPISISDEQIQEIIISLDSTQELAKVRNATIVLGQELEVDFYTAQSSHSNGAIYLAIQGYGSYMQGDMIGFKVPLKDNLLTYPVTININGLGAIQLLNEYDDSPVLIYDLNNSEDYVIKLKKVIINGVSTNKFYLLGQYQVKACVILTGATPDVSIINILKQDLNCDIIEFIEDPNSPFTVEKIGFKLDIKTGGEYDKITSNSLALGRARYENWKSARLTDSITLTTLLIPWVKVNSKISYKKPNTIEEEQYIIKSVTHNLESGTSTLNCYKFVSLYE